jgi:hypothetical protein
LCIACGIALIFAEIFVRTFPYRFAQYLFPSTVTYKKDKDIGYVFTPNQKSIFCSECFRIYPLTTNSLGFRDNEWGGQGGFKIGILGNSFLMAREVSDDNTASFILEKILNKEVLNSAISGHGTVTQLAIYKKLLRPHRPNITILFFTIGNDIHDNSCELISMLHYPKTQPCGYIIDGKTKININFNYLEKSEPLNLKKRIKEFIKNHFLSLLVINRFIFQKSYTVFHRDELIEREIWSWQVYIPPKTKVWQDAWKITEEAIADLKKEVESDKGRLLIVPIPQYIVTSKTWERAFKKYWRIVKIPDDFDPLYPTKRLKDICRKYNIALLELDQDFQQYRDSFNLKEPYFSYWCDGHYNPLGQFLISYLIAKYLIGQNWIPLENEEKERLLKKIERGLNLSPQEILGKEAQRQIYRRGVYLGVSNISKILNDN